MASQKFWSDASIEPKRKYRFLLSFNGIPQWIVKTTGKPNFSVSESEHSFINYKFYYPGRLEWEEISMTLVDPVDPDMSATFSDIITQGGYAPPTDQNSLGTISKAKATSALGAVTITQIDSDGNPIETWTLWNPFIEDIKYGESLDYGNAELTEISISLRYDWARIETANDSSAVASGGREFFNV